MKIDFKGLKFKNWLYLTIFSVFILFVLWILQIAFINTFYENMKLNEIKSIGNNIVGAYEESNFDEILNDYAFKNNLRIVLLDENGNITNTFDGFNTRFDSPRMMFPTLVFDEIIAQLDEASSGRIYYLDNDKPNDMGNSTPNEQQNSGAVYAAKVTNENNETNYLYISTPIPSIASTISVLRTQFVIISIILFILSLIVAQLISKKMSRPIIKLTKSSEKLAQGNFDVGFNNNDYTEIKQLASTLNYATEELKSLETYRKDFVANVSHDLKTPLTIIKMYGEIIRDISGDNSQKRTEYCNIIVDESDRLSGMVNEILELSKLQSANIEPEMTDVKISDCLFDILNGFYAFKESEDYIFETDIDTNLSVTGNEQYIRRALYNLITNAINYTGDDKRIIISLKKLNNKVRFEVTDTGDGIPENAQKNIWERYYKSSQAHKRAVVGTGLGLSIVKSMLDIHHANYGVISKPNQGSTFWFEI